MGFMTRFKRNGELQAGQEKILRDKELMLDVLSESMQGQRICPILSQGPGKPQKCIGKFCEFFIEYKTNNGGKYSRCSFNQIPALQIELLQELRTLNRALLGIAKETAEELKAKELKAEELKAEELKTK